MNIIIRLHSDAERKHALASLFKFTRVPWYTSDCVREADAALAHWKKQDCNGGLATWPHLRVDDSSRIIPTSPAAEGTISTLKQVLEHFGFYGHPVGTTVKQVLSGDTTGVVATVLDDCGYQIVKWNTTKTTSSIAAHLIEPAPAKPAAKKPAKTSKIEATPIKEVKPTNKETTEMAQAKGIVERAKEAASTTVTENKNLMVQAATLEAGGILCQQAAKFLTPKLPALLRGYADTPLGRVIIMNLISLSVKTTMPNVGENHPIRKVTDAAIVTCYQDAIRTLNIGEMLEEMFSTGALGKAMEKVGREYTEK